MENETKTDDYDTIRENNRRVSDMKYRLVEIFSMCDKLVKEMTPIFAECKKVLANETEETHIKHNELKDKVAVMKHKLLNELSKCEKLVEAATNLLEECEDNFRVERTVSILKDKMETMTIYSNACNKFIS